MSHNHAPNDAVHSTQEFWDDRYRSADRLWSGQPNPQLVAQTSELTPAAALDAGCGEGADAIWLASRGWTVTAVDLSEVALERAASHAAAQGDEIAGRISWRHEDLLSWKPEPPQFDLVSAQFMHLASPALEQVNASLAAAVRHGGTLLIVGHHPDDLHVNVGRPAQLATVAPVEQLAAALDADDWEIMVATAIGRPATDLDGQPVTVTDAVLRATRR